MNWLIKLIRLLGFAGSIVMILGGGLYLLAYWAMHSDPPTIVDYAPTTFAEKAAIPFFYSVGIDPKNRNYGVDLRYADHFDPQGKVIFPGSLRQVIPSPDNAKALVVSNDVLWIVAADGGVPVRVADVADIYQDRKPLGKKFFRSDEMQWSADSSRVYLIKDEFYESKGVQLFSKHGELYEYDVSSRQLRQVVVPFRAFQYFVADGSGIFYAEPDEHGDLILKVHQGGDIAVVDTISRQGFSAKGKDEKFKALPFHTFSINAYAQDILPSLGVKVAFEGDKNRIAHLVINGRKLIAVHEVQGAKGRYFGLHSIRSAFLPGNRYFLLNLSTENIDGQLLFDLESGHYRPLPQDSRIYLNINTYNFSAWTITKMNQVAVDRSKEDRDSHVWW